MKIRQEFSIFVLQNSALAVNLATQFLLTIFLPLNIFGVFAKVFVVRDIIVALLSFSLGMSVIFNKASDKEVLVATSFYLSLIQAFIIIFFGVLIGFVLLATGYFNNDELLIFLFLIGTSLFTVFYNVFFSLFERDERFVFNSLLSLAISVVASGLVILFAVYFKNIVPLLVREFASLFFLSGVYFFLIVKNFGVKVFRWENVRKDVMKEVASYSFKMYFSRLAEAFYFRLDLLVVSRLFNTEVIGLYERTRYFATLPWTTIISYINRVHFVKYVKSYSERLFKRTNYYAVLLNFFLFILLLAILFGLSEFSNEQVWQPILVLSPFFGGYAIGAFVENYKTLFYAQGKVIYAMVTLRIVPIILFLLFSVLFYFFFSINVYWIALLSSGTYISSVIIMKLNPRG